MPRSPRADIPGVRGSANGQCLRKCDLDGPPARRKIGVALGQCPETMPVLGQHHPGVDAKGGPGARLADRVPQGVDVADQQIGTPIAQSHGKEEGSSRDPVAAIIRHGASMRPGEEGRNTLRSSALPLAGEALGGTCPNGKGVLAYRTE